ncbi:MAG: AMP-dependent synthetase [Rhodobacteraceae bacterium PARR1]|nr:MAG: AMP-dependent synthetase [Rhodobacteraceae bacterium PARR1]
MTAGAEDRFRWHPAARLFGPDGAEVAPLANGPPVLDDLDSPTALAAAMAQNGRAFRIGAVDQPAPPHSDLPEFETLTSGTSGTPRRIRRSQSSWTASFAVNAGLFGIGPNARVAVLGRLSHSLALYAGVEGLHLGADVHLLDRLRPDRQRRALTELGITHLYATPAQLRLLTDAPGPALPLDHVILGGSKLDPTLRAALAALAPQARVAEFYGAAETSFITLSSPDLPQDSVGRAYPGVDIVIRDGSALVPEGQVGAVWVRSRYLFQGYGDNAPGPAQRDGDWMSVGEIGTLRDGCLYLHGRAGRMVTVADQNVFPEEIEGFLVSLGLSRVAVLPRPDPLRGTVLVAVAQGDGQGDGQGTAAILRAARDRFGPLKAPRAMMWRADWPELSSGKPDLARLAAEWDV